MRLVLFFLLVPVCLFADLPEELVKKAKNNETPFVVLGFVADSEREPAILPEGRNLRKQTETDLQKAGATIEVLSMSLRHRWERMFSTPFTGTFSDELIEELKREREAHIVAGSYPAHNPVELTYLLHLVDEGRTLVFYSNTEPSPDVMHGSVPVPAVNRDPSVETAVTEAPDSPKRIPPSPVPGVDIPEHLLELETKLLGEKDAKQFRQTVENLSAKELRTEYRHQLDAGKGSFWASSKRRAYLRALVAANRLNSSALRFEILQKLSEVVGFLSEEND